MAEKPSQLLNGGVSLNTPIPSSGNQAVYTDISSLLQSACSDLREGELIHAENFNLFAAMSALEIMDPKMDSGIIRTYFSVDEAIENGAAPVPLSYDRTTDVQRTIDIMDHLVACEATWHNGHSLVQTVFSCIYLLRTERTSSHPILHSYCRVMRATCHELISAAMDTRTNEEEDIFTMSHGVPLKGDGDDKCLSMLHAVDETVSRQLRAARSPSSKKRNLEDIEPLQSNIDLEEGLCKALLCRLRFRKHFYHVLACMRRPQGKGLESARKHAVTCLSELDLMLKLEEFLKLNNSCGTDEDGRECKTTASGCEPVGFDSTLNSRLSAPTPPRAIKLLSWKQAIEYFRKLLLDLEIICSLTLDPVFDDLLRFIVDFQKSRPDLVARTYLQLLLIQDGKLYGRNCIFDVICMASQLPEAAKRHSIKNNEVVCQLGQLLINLLKIVCANTAWQRRKLGKILQDWRIIYVQLEIAFKKEFGDLSSTLDDESLHAKICRHILNWVEELTYWIASRFLLLGFELELYSSNEYCMVYWYIYVILIKLAEKTHRKMLASSETNRRKGKKKKELLKDTSKDFKVPPSVSLLQCQIYVAEGLTLMLAALRNEKQTFQDPGLFNSEHEIFMQHFGLLQKACLPDHVFYSSFKEITSQASLPTIAMYNCFKDAQRIAKELRSSFANDPARMEELRRIEQVAERNDVALNLICRLGKLDPSLNVYFEFNHHPYFAIAAVKRS